MSKRNSDYYRREWLNLPDHHASAHVLAYMKDNWGEVVIADCGRQISLALDVDNALELKNAIYKIDLLRSVLGDISKRLHAKQRARIKKAQANGEPCNMCGK